MIQQQSSPPTSPNQPRIPPLHPQPPPSSINPITDSVVVANRSKFLHLISAAEWMAAKESDPRSGAKDFESADWLLVAQKDNLAHPSPEAHSPLPSPPPTSPVAQPAPLLDPGSSKLTQLPPASPHGPSSLVERSPPPSQPLSCDPSPASTPPSPVHSAALAAAKYFQTNAPAFAQLPPDRQQLVEDALQLVAKSIEGVVKDHCSDNNCFVSSTGQTVSRPDKDKPVKLVKPIEASLRPLTLHKRQAAAKSVLDNSQLTPAQRRSASMPPLPHPFRNPHNQHNSISNIQALHQLEEVVKQGLEQQGPNDRTLVGNVAAAAIGVRWALRRDNKSIKSISKYDGINGDALVDALADGVHRILTEVKIDTNVSVWPVNWVIHECARGQPLEGAKASVAWLGMLVLELLGSEIPTSIDAIKMLHAVRTLVKALVGASTGKLSIHRRLTAYIDDDSYIDLVNNFLQKLDIPVSEQQTLVSNLLAADVVSSVGHKLARSINNPLNPAASTIDPPLATNLDAALSLLAHVRDTVQ